MVGCNHGTLKKVGQSEMGAPLLVPAQDLEKIFPAHHVAVFKECHHRPQGYGRICYGGSFRGADQSPLGSNSQAHENGGTRYRMYQFAQMTAICFGHRCESNAHTKSRVGDTDFTSGLHVKAIDVEFHLNWGAPGVRSRGLDVASAQTYIGKARPEGCGRGALLQAYAACALVAGTLAFVGRNWSEMRRRINVPTSKHSSFGGACGRCGRSGVLGLPQGRQV